MRALAGIRVLDLSRVLAGPLCAQTLGDLGAEVIKIENVGGGDDTRTMGAAVHGNDTSFFNSVNRNKKSIALDLTTEEGQKIAADLAAECDVVIENFKLGGAAKFGLDYESLKKRNEKLIYCSISGYGREGDFNHRLGYDLVIQGEAGLMFANGDATQEPLRFGIAIVDLVTGHHAAQACLAALFARERTGEGQAIDICLFDSGLALLAYHANNSLWLDQEPPRLGNSNPYVAPYGLFKVSDGYVILAIANDGQFRRLAADVLGAGELNEDDRFKTNQLRAKNKDALHELMQPYLDKLTRAQLCEALVQHKLPGGEVRTVLEALRSAEAASRSMVHTVAHPHAGDVSLIGSPLRLSKSGVEAVNRPPSLGENSREVLTMLDYTDDQIKGLIDKGIVETRS
ncbi:CaiB/BaiF CoA transferase family protein [Sneathiella glossodoripedis]|uniref:CaiB/BaiF CoA transferase family protein n=1 Tax=Sneathiella glossodoripedis TaxID=418853 RepID=UPI00046EC028|nr:CoA transferase [Sneathiella glossodoripedis]